MRTEIPLKALGKNLSVTVSFCRLPAILGAPSLGVASVPSLSTGLLPWAFLCLNQLLLYLVKIPIIGFRARPHPLCPHLNFCEDSVSK